jgi:hypothetical protein
MTSSVQADIDAGVDQLYRALDSRAEVADIDFCKVWPEAKAILNAIANFVPVIGKAVVSLLVAIGDGVYKKKNCK